MSIDSQFPIVFQGVDMNLQRPELSISKVDAISEWVGETAERNSSDLRSRDNHTVEVVP